MFSKTPYTSLRPDEKIRIVFLFQFPSFWPSWESVYQACSIDGRYDVKLVWLDRLAFSKAQAAGAKEFLEENQINYIKFNDFDFQATKPHIVVLQLPYDPNSRVSEAMSYRFLAMGVRVVYIPYGIEISDTPVSRLNHFYTFTILNAWRIYVISEKMADLYGEYCPNRAAVRVFGHPKFDAYANGGVGRFSAQYEDMIEGRRVVLWKMHFPKKEDGSALVTPSLSEYLKFANMISEYPHIYFIFMPHPLMMMKTNEIEPDLQAQSDKIISILAKLENVRVYTESDYRPALLRADAIIIDRSALMIEAGITGKPILYMYNRDNTEKLTDAIIPLMETYYHGTTAGDMVRFIEQFQKGFDLQKEEREKAFNECVPYTDGKCGERISNDMAVSIACEAQAHQRRKIAVFGIGGLFRYYWEETDVFKNSDFDIVVFSDNNALRWGDHINNIPIVAPKDLRDCAFDKIVILSERYFMEIYKQLVYEVCLDMDSIERLDRFLAEANSDGGQ